MQQLREYFRQTYAGRIGNAEEAREDMVGRFHLEPKRWYVIRRQLQEINEEAWKQGRTLPPANNTPTESNGQEQGELIILPEGTPNREALNRLLEENRRLAHEVTLKDVEIATLRGQNSALSSKNSWFKRLIHDLMERM